MCGILAIILSYPEENIQKIQEGFEMLETDVPLLGVEKASGL